MHVIPTHRQSQPHQMGSMWTASKISAASSTVASLQPPPPMSEPLRMRYLPGRFLLTAEVSGEFRVTMMASRSRLAVGTKSVSNRCGQLGDTMWDRLGGVFRMLIGYAVLRFSHQEHKKIRRPSSGGGKFLEISCSEDHSPAHRPLWVKAPCRLQRQAAGFGLPNHS